MIAFEEIDAIVDEVLAAPEAERPAVVARRCGDNEALRLGVEEFLAICEEAEHHHFLEKPPTLVAEQRRFFDGAVPEAPSEDLAEGERVGAYRVVERIGRGGMGAVYLAERADGHYHARVALKVVKRGMDTHEINQRFRYEREILARLDHPNIARLLDAGITEDGRPYFVMAYVEGERLDAYCDRRCLSIRQRLALFAQVCEAVAYAHRNLVVHRDLKPSNILVAEDAEGAPHAKLLDFGIAKLLDDDPVLGTRFETEAGTRRLTPRYAAPEQVRALAVTTATDVYALGVLLYELLTGRPPYAVERGRLEEIVCHEVPSRPSTQVLRPTDDPFEEAADLSAQRALPPNQLRRTLAGDLDAVTLKALKKEPERRYASAAELLDDIHRYLGGRPVVAQDDTVRYRLVKFVQRHKVGVAAAALVMLSLVAGIIGTATQAYEAQQARARAEQEAANASAALDFFVQNLALADRDAPLDPRLALGDTLTRQDWLERFVAQLATLRHPLDRAQAMEALAAVFITYNAFDRADSLYQQALQVRRAVQGAAHPDLAATLKGLGVVAQNRDETARADSLFQEALGLLGEEAGGRSPLAVELRNLRGYVLHRLRRYAESRASYEAALRLGDALAEAAPDDDALLLLRAGTRRGLATVLTSLGALDAAEVQAEAALVMLREGPLGPQHTEVANVLAVLGRTLVAQGRYVEARRSHGEALALYEAAYQPGHKAIARSLYALAALHRCTGCSAGVLFGIEGEVRLPAAQELQINLGQ